MLLAIHTLINIVIIALLFAILLGTLRRRQVPAGREFAVVVIFEILALAASAVSLVQRDPVSKMVWNELRFIGLACISPGNLVFVSRLLELKYINRRRNVALIFVIPLLVILAAFTNSFHHLFRHNWYIDNYYSVEYVYFDQGPVFWLHMAYSYVIILVAIGLMIAEQLKKPAMYRGQINVMLATIGSTVVFNLVLVLGVFLDYADFSTAFFALAAIGEYWGLFLYKPKRLEHSAKDLALNSMSNLVIIFDYKERLLEYNTKAGELFGLTGDSKTKLEDFFAELGISPKAAEVAVKGFYFNLDGKSIYDKKGRFAGRVLVFSDVTGLRNTLTQVQYTAGHDLMTGLENEYMFNNRLRAIDAEGVVPLSICCCHVPNVKMVNEVFGVEHGDEMIRRTAEEMRQHFGPGDICARIRGGEFAIALRGLGAEETLEAISKKLSGAGGVPISLIYGVAVKHKPRENISVVLQRSIDEMYSKKLLQDTFLLDEMVNYIKDTMNSRGLGENEDELYEVCEKLYAASGAARPDDKRRLRLFIEMHNVGMLNVPEEIYNKRGSLSNSEWEIMKLHTVRGYHIAMSMPGFTGLAQEILSHHERYDGLGYPNRLKADEIPLLCRILAVGEFYTENKSAADVTEQLRGLAGRRFDPDIVELLIDMEC